MVMTNAGLNAIRNMMGAVSETAPTHLEVGSYSYTPAYSDTTITGSYFRKAFTGNEVTSDKINSYECLIAINEANNTTMYAAGILNASQSGTLYGEDTFVSIAKTGSMEIQFDVNIGYSDI